ncbi:MAG TPA: non-homologous end-joining DNA ligase [Acidobacteriota bacterium]|nr:non-homologous end-joining DNA ligase [Acidobacteriota bacterium]
MPSKPPFSKTRTASLKIPRDSENVELNIDGRKVRITNVNKVFWKKLGITKGDLLQYYADVSRYLLPHIVDRPMVMKRYPNGAESDFFYMKRAPVPRPEWIETCEIVHGSGNVIDFPVIQDLASLMWLINLGCIDLNPWYARQDDYDRPDFLHFDLDPTPGAEFSHMRDAAMAVHKLLNSFKMPNFAKTTGSRGIHIYVPIVRGPIQKEVWTIAKTIAQILGDMHPKLLTAEYRKEKRPPKQVLVDYNQNRWGSTLSSIYSVRPTSRATVSTPVTWEEIEEGVDMQAFRIDTVPDRLKDVGDLWKPVLGKRRVDLSGLTEQIQE